MGKAKIAQQTLFELEEQSKEGTGEELYREIQAKKQRLAKKEKPLPEIKEDEIPFEIPEGWIWTKLANVAKWGSGGTPSRRIPSYYTGTIPWIKSGELNNNVIYETEEHITEEAIVNSNAKLFPVNTVIIAMYGATIGKVGIMGIPSTTNQACACAACRNSLNHMYLYFYAISQRENFINRGKGGAQPNISQEILKDYPIPLPPLPEQKRIVALIESLFSRLDEARAKAQEVIDGFEPWKSAVLHKAFTGQLVEQRPEEGTGEELYREIQVEKKRLAKKEKPLPEIKEDEIPFEIPEGWKWVRLGEVLDVRDGTHDTPKYTSVGIPLVTSKNLVNGRIDFETAKLISSQSSILP